jgi:hypothetical protein
MRADINCTYSLSAHIRDPLSVHADADSKKISFTSVVSDFRACR